MRFIHFFGFAPPKPDKMNYNYVISGMPYSVGRSNVTDLKLNNEETTILNEALSRSLSMLHDEIAHTDSSEYRIILRNRKSVLLHIQSLLN